ncbi:MAG: hypothetical protein EOP22_01220 [Hyphomicrobiales bacterium]|nr:MAG: hypothetical protein EOP22_01220 [Hyphomicrobiales bacterium]
MQERAQVEVWLIDVDRHGAQFARHATGKLSPAEQRRLGGFRDPLDARVFAASRGGLRQLARRWNGAADTALQRTKAGKPFVPGLPDFSLSHTRSHVAIAVNHGGIVGVDIEGERPVPEHDLIARVARVLGEGRAARSRTIEAWTVIEAWTKCHGLTLAEALDSPTRAREIEASIQTGADGLHLAVLKLPAGLFGACWYGGAATIVSVNGLEPESYLYPNASA